MGGQCAGPYSGDCDGLYPSRLPNSSNDNKGWYTNHSGSGGEAGKGGNIYYSDNCLIYAYNGNMITNGDYSSTYYDYSKDGIISGNLLNIVTKFNGDKFIPCKIFAQSGVIRATYTTNCAEYSLSKVAEGLEKPEVANSYDTVVCVKATEEKIINVTNYSNGYMLNQGIGSGAGYLEKENGIFEKNSFLN